MKIAWNKDCQPMNGSRSVCLHADGSLSISKPRYGEWTNTVSGVEYDDVVAWVSDYVFPFEDLNIEDLAALSRAGWTKPNAVRVQ